ncbi:hypothetical protein [Aeromonas phage 14AhydR10PP]|nr:hypothetical protein [Aeromonas phage 14AhydR10PP]
MFDINLTRNAITQVEEAQDLNTQLARLMCDVADGRGYMIMQGATTVSVVARQQGETRVVKIYPSPFLRAKRYTKDDATIRLNALPDPTLYRVVRVREALKLQGDAMAAYHGTLRKSLSDSCEHARMESGL